MFTGIIESLGRVAAMDTPEQGGLRLAVDCDFSEVILGESIAINGVCLTVVDNTGNLAFDVSPETLACTSLGHLNVNAKVNLERAMLPTTRFGGHIVSGHVDALATIESIQLHDGFYTVQIAVDESLLRYVVKKGSVAIDGCSLTVNAITTTGFSVMIIPHTWQHTVFHQYKQGSQVNIEVDMIARYVERLIIMGGETTVPANSESPILLASQAALENSNV